MVQNKAAPYNSIATVRPPATAEKQMRWIFVVAGNEIHTDTFHLHSLIIILSGWNSKWNVDDVYCNNQEEELATGKFMWRNFSFIRSRTAQVVLGHMVWKIFKFLGEGETS